MALDRSHTSSYSFFIITMASPILEMLAISQTPLLHNNPGKLAKMWALPAVYYCYCLINRRK